MVDMFAAAMWFHRAAPWRFVTDLCVSVRCEPAGFPLSVLVFGSDDFAGLMAEGFVLDEPGGEFAAFDAAVDAANTIDPARGACLILSFVDPAEFPDYVNGEAESYGWDRGATNAYPVLISGNTRGRHITRENIAQLAAILRAVPPFVDEHRERLANETYLPFPLVWTDPDTGVELRYETDDPFAVSGSP
jgi:hypothetical protein